MKESTIIGTFNALDQKIQQVYNSIRLAVSGESLRNQALQELLMEKGLITEVELNKKIGEVIQKINTQEAPATAEAPKVEIIAPTPEQTAQIASEAPKA